MRKIKFSAILLVFLIFNTQVGLAQNKAQGVPFQITELKSAVVELQDDLSDAGGEIDDLKSALAAETAARMAADQALQDNIEAEAASRVSADQSLLSNIDTEAATRMAADQSLQAAISAEESARIAADVSQDIEIDKITTTESFTSRVPVELDDLSLTGGVQIKYTDEGFFAQNTNAAVFDMQADGTLLILKEGTVSISASLGVQINSDNGSSNASLSIQVNGLGHASSFVNIADFGGDTLHTSLKWRVQAGDALTFYGFAGNNINPATQVCCNDSVLSVQWVGIN